MALLDKALKTANIALKKYDTSKARPVYTDTASLSVPKFVEVLVAGLKKDLKLHPEIIDCISDHFRMQELLEEWSVENAIDPFGSAAYSIPADLEHLTLNVDTSSVGRKEDRFFCTTSEELRSEKISGSYFMDKSGMGQPDAMAVARPVVPRYLPRRSLGIHKTFDPTTNENTNYLNTYVPASWDLWRRRNPGDWAKIKSTPPADFMTMLKHIIPAKAEREYLYAWLYTSIVARCYVYLVLQGIPGLGKNRLQILISGLHGISNSVNGKKETFGAGGNKFNGQLFNVTAAWFDELKYDRDMEPRMKEYQNDTASKELKGIDATNRSELYCSMVVSNNYQRDNYILFNSRKFAPIVLGETPLKELMSEDEISKISDKLDESSSKFDVKYVAQIAKWILKIGPKYAAHYPRLEYQGPKFWELAHASMSRWQKVVVVALTTKTRTGYFPGWHEARKAFQWTEVETALRRKKDLSDKDYRDPSTVKAFFDNYRDTEGEKVFDTKAFTGSILQDFWVWPLENVQTVAGDVTVRLDNGEAIKILGKDPEELLTERPRGMSNFQWRKLQRSQETKMRKENKDENETDLL